MVLAGRAREGGGGGGGIQPFGHDKRVGVLSDTIPYRLNYSFGRFEAVYYSTAPTSGGVWAWGLAYD